MYSYLRNQNIFVVYIRTLAYYKKKTQAGANNYKKAH